MKNGKKAKRRLDGTPVKTRYYGCGGYITKGRSICELNAIPQEFLESLVTDTVIDFYRPYLASGGHRKLAQIVKTQISSESKELVAARKRTYRQLNKIKKVISNLLDNITSVNRQLVDKRLHELQQRKAQLETRLEELNRLIIPQAEIRNMISEAIEFISGLEFTLHQGLPQEKLVALRRCIEKIKIDKPDGTVRLIVRSVPVGNLDGTVERQVSL